MELWTGLAIYFIIWWMVLFMVLPWGVRRIEPGELGKGEDPGAPVKAHLLVKFAVTTVVAGVIFGLVYLVIVSGVISFRT